MNTQCPKCSSSYVYAEGELWICPECAHEWSSENKNETTEAGLVVKDASGNVLKDGDSVTVIKNLPVKGASQDIKVGTKVKNIRLVESSNGHNISCKIEGFGAMALKSEFVRKA
ncbi:alkylphosphonate utilization protein [bacterium]|nr:alkylphosphonate utilization protein [bacterium]